MYHFLNHSISEQEHQVLSLGFMSSAMDKKTKVLDRTTFYGWIDSDEAAQVMHEIEAEPDGEKKNEIKRRRLPVAIYAAVCSEGGNRPKKDDNPLATGLCIHDFDHMECSPREFYERVVNPVSEQLRVVLAHVSPRGEGLRLVTELEDGESIIDCQRRVAQTVGLERDEHVHDITRLSFLPSREYLIYIDEAKLFDRVAKVGQKEAEKAQETAQEAPRSEAVETVAPATATLLTKALAENMSYQGVSFSRIIEEILKRFATGGTPKAGERNNDLYALVREIRPLTTFNFETTYMLVAPYFAELGLSDSEIRKTINSALLSPGGRTVSPSLTSIIRDLRMDSLTNEKDYALPSITTLPRVLRTITKCYPKKQREAVVLSALSMLGTYATNVRTTYVDGSVQSCTFLVHIVAEFGSGKGFMTDLFRKLLHKLEVEDEVTRDKLEDARLDALNARNKGEETKRPLQIAPRVLGDDITLVTLYKYLSALNGQHCIIFTEEILQLLQNLKSQYSNIKTFFLKSFDNSRMTHETANQETPNYVIDHVRMNTCTSGTFKNTLRFFTLEDGLASRIAFATFPSNLTDPIPVYSPFTDKALIEVNGAIKALREEGSGDEVFYQLPKVTRAIKKMVEAANETYIDGGDEAYRKFVNRAALYGMRAGLLAYCLEGHKETKTVVDFAIQVANYVRECQYALFGEKWNEESSDYNITARQGANKTLLSDLPDAFTRQDVVRERSKNGNSSTNVRMVIKRWRDKGLIRECDDGTFVKIHNLQTTA